MAGTVRSARWTSEGVGVCWSGRTVNFTSAAINAPALGLQGSGTIAFDGEMDLHIIALPLGDWRDRVKQTNLPLLSDVAGEVVGAIQGALNTATSTLLYEFRVT